jgi:putative YphP/YqiW family bacilliredoxin
MYPELMVIPMREELTKAGVLEARSATEVDEALAKPGTTMLVVNSICGCAAGKMRPGVRLALQHATKPDQTITVFAGQDREATERARSYFQGHPPTSPARAILRDGLDCPRYRSGTGPRLRHLLRQVRRLTPSLLNKSKRASSFGGSPFSCDIPHRTCAKRLPINYLQILPIDAIWTHSLEPLHFLP